MGAMFARKFGETTNPDYPRYRQSEQEEPLTREQKRANLADSPDDDPLVRAIRVGVRKRYLRGQSQGPSPTKEGRTRKRGGRSERFLTGG